MFSQRVEYALRAVIYIASQSPRACSASRIAAATRVPKAYLHKVLRALTEQGILTSQRGIGGGVKLARPASKMTVLEVVNAIEPIVRIEHCPLGLAAHGVKLCPLHARLDRALATLEKAFQSTTVAEILSEPTTSIPLCDFPAQGGGRPVPER